MFLSVSASTGSSSIVVPANVLLFGVTFAFAFQTSIQADNFGVMLTQKGSSSVQFDAHDIEGIIAEIRGYLHLTTTGASFSNYNHHFPCWVDLRKGETLTLLGNIASGLLTGSALLHMKT